MQSVSIIGIGRIGGALAIALSRAGYRVEHLVHRGAAAAQAISAHLPQTVKFVASPDPAHRFESDILIISTADPEIASVAAGLPGRMNEKAVILHTSGSLSSNALSLLSEAGYSTASMHPLISVSEAVSGADSFGGAFFCIEGDPKASAVAKSIAQSLGGKPFSIDSTQKPLYHAAAVMACGHLVALVDMAVEMLSRCGVDEHTAKEILFPLISTTVENLATRSPEQALTGSFARLDVDAVKRHLIAIESQMSEPIREAYLLLGERSLELAASNGRSPTDVDKVREVISIAKRKSG